MKLPDFLSEEQYDMTDRQYDTLLDLADDPEAFSIHSSLDIGRYNKLFEIYARLINYLEKHNPTAQELALLWKKSVPAIYQTLESPSFRKVYKACTGNEKPTLYTPLPKAPKALKIPKLLKERKPRVKSAKMLELEERLRLAELALARAESTFFHGRGHGRAPAPVNDSPVDSKDSPISTPISFEPLSVP
jgi:hypothetical protein